MNRSSSQSLKGKWLAAFAFAVGVLLIGNSNQLAVQKESPASGPVEIEQGKKASSSFTIGNHCAEPHRLRVTTNAKYLHFEQPTDAILIGPASKLQLGVLFDTTGLEIRVHQGKLIVECLDCDKQARKCMQSPMELPFEIAVTKPAPPKTPDSLRSDINETQVSTAQLERLTSDENFKAALEVVTGNNEAVDLKSGRLLTSPSAPGLSEIVFNVTVKDTKEPGEYAKLVYMEQTGESPIVFFDEKRMASIAVGGQQGGAAGSGKGGKLGDLLDCLLTSWGPWTVLNNYCSNNFWCFMKKQQALYLTETRSKTCKMGTFSQTRTIKAHCGC